MDDRIRPRPEQRWRLTVYEMYNRQSYISPKHKIFQRIYITENISLRLINKLVTLTNLTQIYYYYFEIYYFATISKSKLIQFTDPN